MTKVHVHDFIKDSTETYKFQVKLHAVIQSLFLFTLDALKWMLCLRSMPIFAWTFKWL